MGSYYETIDIERAIEKALPSIMEGQIADDVRTAITQATVSEVYMAYDPIYQGRNGIPGRRWHEGGLADPNKEYYVSDYDQKSMELTVQVKTPWQNRGFKTTTGAGTGGNDLADVIEKNGMYNAPARPFMKQADSNVKKIHNELENTIADYLNSVV